MKKLFLLTFLFIFAIASFAFAQNGNMPCGKKMPHTYEKKVITQDEARALADEAVSTLQGYSIKEFKEIALKKGSSYEAILTDSNNENNLSIIVSRRGHVKGPFLTGSLPNAKKMNTAATDSATAEKLATDFLSPYKGFFITAVDTFDMPRGKCYRYTVLDSHKNVFYLMVGPKGVRHGLVMEYIHNKMMNAPKAKVGKKA